LFTGCIEEESNEEKPEEIQGLEVTLDQPSILPDWEDGEYHDYYGTTQMLNDFNDRYPNLVNVFSIGKSVLDKEIWCIRLTNEKNNQKKFSCLIDGCIHGCEWEAGEACLYLAEYLLINFECNTTVTDILNITEIYIVPLLNPDGRQKDDRFNDNGIDLNRNFDIDFGRIRGRSLRIGKPLGFIKIPYIELPRRGIYTNCGRRAFSEPESKAIRDFMDTIRYADYSFYINCHTAAHGIIGPWIAFKPPFEMTQHEITTINYVIDWVAEHTEYEPYRSGELITYEGKPIYMSGSIMDWVFKEYHIPSFTFEILSEDYEMYMGQGKHDHLAHWMKTTLPVFMYLLVNIDNLHSWKTPDIQPPLPEGVPPDPLT
jgi:hypothetical protein